MYEESKKQTLTTLPANPPAMNANPMNKNSLARQTARESPKPSSPLTRSLSMRLTMIIPSSEQMPGTQSTKETCTGGGTCGSPIGGCACAERIAASRNVQFASANYTRGNRRGIKFEATAARRRGRTSPPAMYIPIVRLCFPNVQFGNGLRHTRLGS